MVVKELLGSGDGSILVYVAPRPVGNSDEFSLTTSNTQEGAHLDVAMNGFWDGQSERCFVDVRVFNPYASYNKCSSLAAAYKKHRNIKTLKHQMPCLWPANSGSGACLFYTSCYVSHW